MASRDPVTGKALPGTSLREREMIDMLADQGQVMRWKRPPDKQGRRCPSCGLDGQNIEWQQHRDVERPHLYMIRTCWSCFCGHKWDWGQYDARKRHY